MCVGLCILIKLLQILFGKKWSTNIYKWSFTGKKKYQRPFNIRNFLTIMACCFNLWVIVFISSLSCLASPWHLSSQPGMCLCICEAGWASLPGSQRRGRSCCWGDSPNGQLPAWNAKHPMWRCRRPLFCRLQLPCGEESYQPMKSWSPHTCPLWVQPYLQDDALVRGHSIPASAAVPQGTRD